MKLGIDMGGMSIKMGLVNEENKIIGRITIPTDLTVPYQTLVERMADAVRQMLENAGMTLEQCGGIGIGSPGTIDAKQGVILYSNNFGWENVPIVEELKKHLDTRIEIANDADAAALGEVCAGAIVIKQMFHFSANSMSSVVRIIVPSSRMISQHKPHSFNPARRIRSTVASV